MNIEQKVCEYILKQGLLKNAQNVAVGVSGGADSVFLLYFLAKYKQKYGIKNLYAVHVNHNLRGEESDIDEGFVKKLCAEFGVPCVIKSVDVRVGKEKTKTGLEECARNLRYEEFNKFAKQNSIDYFCLAHHKGDQAETVLMHILRGAGLSGACGMLPQNGIFERPLLCVSKEEIIDSLNELNISYRTDSSNFDNTYSRNFLRNDIFPKLEQVFPNCIDSICSFAEKCKQDEEFIVSNLNDKYLLNKNGEIFISEEVENLPVSLKTRIARKAFVIAGATKDIEEKHIAMLFELFKMKTGAKQNFPMDIEAHKDYNGVALRRNVKLRNNTDEVEFKCPDKLTIEGVDIEVCFADNVKFEDGIHWCDYLKIPNDAVWRTKRNGDVFAKLGSGTKKLADYFTDKKIALRDRNNIPLLCSKNEVLLVAEFDIGEKLKIDDTTEKIIKIVYRRK